MFHRLSTLDTKCLQDVPVYSQSANSGGFFERLNAHLNVVARRSRGIPKTRKKLFLVIMVTIGTVVVGPIQVQLRLYIEYRIYIIFYILCAVSVPRGPVYYHYKRSYCSTTVRRRGRHQSRQCDGATGKREREKPTEWGRRPGGKKTETDL